MQPNRLRKATILAAVEQGCNITSDIAAVTGLPRNLAAAWVTKLLKAGELHRNRRVIRYTGGRPATCFERTP